MVHTHDRPPLLTNDHERDVHVTKISGPRSNAIAAAFLGLARTTAQPAIAFWD